jgi:hypothetical protein
MLNGVDIFNIRELFTGCIAKGKGMNKMPSYVRKAPGRGNRNHQL